MSRSYAAAGSGKTTVMVEKIKETLIRDPDESISQFLVRRTMIDHKQKIHLE